jgi:hypothetical protein
MKTILSCLLSLAGIIICIPALVSCEPDRGDKLDGKWQLEKVEQSNGTVNPVDTVWYNFQNTLFMYQLYEPAGDLYRHIYGFKTWESKDRILLKVNPDPVSVESFLPFTDWKSDTRSFSINKCSKGELVLNSEGVTYHFRKF